MTTSAYPIKETDTISSICDDVEDALRTFVDVQNYDNPEDRDEVLAKATEHLIATYKKRDRFLVACGLTREYVRRPRPSVEVADALYDIHRDAQALDRANRLLAGH